MASFLERTYSRYCDMAGVRLLVSARVLQLLGGALA